jgi:hypothetical protein
MTSGVPVPLLGLTRRRHLWPPCAHTLPLAALALLVLLREPTLAWCMRAAIDHTLYKLSNKKIILSVLKVEIGIFETKRGCEANFIGSLS